ncbi:MAG TPA: putative Ig domain-containing protein [Micromonosporaceae bacterium]
MRARQAALALIGTLTLVAGVLVAGPASAAPTTPVVASSKVVRACARSASQHVMSCFALRRTDVTQPPALQAAPNAVNPAATPSGYGPTDLHSAYNLPSSGGSGLTVAIVDAYNDPNAESDLATYRTQYGLSACTTANGCFKKVNQNGATSPLPANNTGWAGEIALDIEMVSAICPSCKILLVEANSASDANLYTAEDYAASHAQFVSNSWGGSEYSGQTTDDSHFNHPGVVITVSSGDDGHGAEYPATSRYVTAVGGTTLNTAGNARGWTETVWNGAGSGCSSFDIKPTWQTVTTGCTRRAEADVAAVANPSTGVAVYQTYGASGWVVYGGTSVAAPIIASVYALAGTAGAGDYPASYPYAHPGNLYDVTSGNNGTCGAPMCTAGGGWDGPTGLGTPNGTAAFTAGGGGGTGVTVTNPGNQTGTVGTATSLTLHASGGTGSYTWSATGLPAGLSINSGSGVISGTPTTANTYTVTATATSGTQNGSTTFQWTINSAGGGCSGQLLGNPGFETGSAAPWTTTAGVVNSTSAGETAHSGSFYAWLDGYGRTHTDTASQTVTIPSGCNATLTFWLKIDTSETTNTTQYDKLTVKVGSTTLATYSNLNHGAYSQKSFNISSFAGSTVTLLFTGTEDVTLQTSFVIDDTAITLS